MIKHSIDELNKMYDEANSCDEELFAEMRSNILLVSGQHFSKKSTQFLSNIRNSARISQEQKLRLTKNHIHKVTRHYINAITSKVPGVSIVPQNDIEMQDRKAAALNQAVWQDAKTRYKLDDKMREWAANFVEIGEVCAYIYFEPHDGKVIGYEEQLDPMTGMPVLDEKGQLVPDETKPIFEGGFRFKTIHGFNLLRSPAAYSMQHSEHHIIREMVKKQELVKIYSEDHDKLKIIGEGDTEDFVVFDSAKKGYGTTKDQVLLRYHFFRPCRLYPQGYFYISTERGVLEEGELPFGIYPIVWRGFEEYASNPRGYSIIKVARPFQAEINRASSQQAQHQIQVGDDKILYQSGTKLAPGALLPGVRGLTYQGAAPQILPGRDGSQFTQYISQNIAELYQACMLEEVNSDKDSGQLDAYTQLFKSASQQQKFAKYTEKFESFLKEVCFIFLELAKHYLPDNALIQAVGKSEAINIPEFRRTTPLSYSIRLEEQSEAIDSKLGRQVALNHVLQYVGNQLDPKQIGLVLKEMPFLNNKTLFKRLTVDYDNCENDMLSLERGTFPHISLYADNKVYVDMLTNRMKQADFINLNPQIQQMYDQYLQMHESELQRKLEAEKALQKDFIPSGGALITCMMQVKDPSKPGKTQQVRLPYEALFWLINRLEAQGSSLETLQNTNPQVTADLANSMQSQKVLQAQQQQMVQNAPQMAMDMPLQTMQ
jgi:hypothetical protein